jgi:hypothetical protein
MLLLHLLCSELAGCRLLCRVQVGRLPVLASYVDNILQDLFSTAMPPPPLDDAGSWSEAAQVRCSAELHAGYSCCLCIVGLGRSSVTAAFLQMHISKEGCRHVATANGISLLAYPAQRWFVLPPAALQGASSQPKPAPTVDDVRMWKGSQYWLAGAAAAVGSYVLLGGHYFSITTVDDDEGEGMDDDDDEMQ